MINATERKAIAAGQTLTATYKKTPYTVEVVAGPEGKLLYRLADGREFKSPSAAGSAVTGGVACNGWRFWSLAGDEQPAAEAEPTHEEVPTPKRTTKKQGCDACGKQFMSAKQLEHHAANAERLCTAAKAG